MRILAVTNIYPTPLSPSSGTFVEQQVEGLRRQDTDVRVLFLDRLRLGPGVYGALAGRLRNEVSDFRPDIVHAMYGGVMAERVTRLTAKSLPTVVTFHGSDVLGENFSGLRRRVASRYGVICSWAAAVRASGLIVVSKSLLASLPRWVDHTKSRVIPCGIDMKRFSPLSSSEARRQLGWEPDGFTVVFNGDSTDAVKRPGLAREAVEELRRRGVPARLCELRGLPNDVVPLWLSAGDALLLTSHQEGSPTVIKEALACNLPIVSVDVGDVAERTAGVDGCYIADATAGALADSLGIVWARQARSAGRSHVQSVSLEVTSAAVREFYEEVVRNWNMPQGKSG